MRLRYLAIVVLASLSGRTATAQIVQCHGSISVSGTAEIRVAPDEVNLRLGIETRHEQLDEAVRQNEQRTAAVLKFLNDAAVEPKDVQTDYLEIQPQYPSDRRVKQTVPEFYQVRRNIGVRLREVGRFDTVMTGVLRHGVNHVHGIDFRTTELRKHRDAAREQAIRAAKEKADALAAELDVKVGRPQTIHEQTGGGYGGWSGWQPYANAISQNTFQATPTGEAPEGNLSIGMISITATVNVSFQLQ
jgi:uncharacterized protein YggE